MHLNVQSWWIFTFVIAEINSCSQFFGIFVVGCTCHLSFAMLLPSDYLNIFIPNNSNLAAMHCNLQDSVNCNLCDSMKFFQISQFLGIFVVGCTCHLSFAMLLPSDYLNVFIPNNSNLAAMHCNLQDSVNCNLCDSMIFFLKFPSFLESLWLAALVTSLLPCCCLQTIWIYSSQIIATLLQCIVISKTQWIVTFVIPWNFFKFPSLLGIFVVGCTCHLSFAMLLPSDYLNVFIPNNSNLAAMHCNLQDSVNCNLCDSMIFFLKFPSFLESLWLAALVTSLLPCCCLQTIWMYSSQTIATVLQCIAIFRLSEFSPLWLHDIHPYLKWMNLYLRRNTYTEILCITVYVVIFAVVLFSRISRVRHRENFHFNLCLFIVMTTSEKLRN